jgi:MFS family permease
MVGGMALAFLLWAFSESFWPLAAFAFAFGLFYGGWVALMPAVVADYFGPRNLGTLIGVISMCLAIGTLIGPSAAGFVFDLRHSYMLPIVASVGAYIIAAAILLDASRPHAQSL